MKKRFSDLITQKLGLLESDLQHSWVSPKGTHIRFFVVDDLLPRQDVENVYKEFRVDEEFWIPRSSFLEKNIHSQRLTRLTLLLER